MKILNLPQACIDFPALALLVSLVRHRSELARTLIMPMDWIRL
jgi:hypothetical protein